VILTPDSSRPFAGWHARLLHCFRAATGCITMVQKARKHEMSKQAMREETERLVKEALERKAITIKQGKTRIESKCAKCGALSRISAAQGEVRVSYTCKECGEEQRTF
jgi:hypothetical protein